jgi:hypothetical protein
LLLLQARREEFAHQAIGRMHRQQHAVEHREADRAGVDLRHPGVRRGGAGGEAAKHQQVIPRGVIEVRRQLAVQQIGHMQIDELAAGPALQRGLHGGAAQFELAARDADPEVAGVGRRFGQRGQLGELVALDVEDAHEINQLSAASPLRARSR